MSPALNVDRLIQMIRKHNHPGYTWSDGLRIGERIRAMHRSEQQGDGSPFSDFLSRPWPVTGGGAIGSHLEDGSVDGVQPQLLISVRRVVRACQRAEGAGT